MEVSSQLPVTRAAASHGGAEIWMAARPYLPILVTGVTRCQTLKYEDSLAFYEVRREAGRQGHIVVGYPPPSRAPSAALTRASSREVTSPSVNSGYRAEIER